MSPKLAQRSLAVAWMAHNLDAERLGERDALLDATLARDGDQLKLRAPAAGEDLVGRVRAAAEAALPCAWPTLYEAAARAAVGLGLPDPAEVRAMTADLMVMRGRQCARR